MKRKRTLSFNSESRPVKTPRQIRHPNLDKREHLFCWLYAVIGYTVAEAYQVSHHSTATLNSCSAMGSRLLRSENVVEYIEILNRYYENYPLEVKIRVR